ncbi:MAG: LPS-assembly protein LptD [Candidatus Cloacimonetes bacterium]|nr:LPS-assembly protein LptD [Candidatus Cloacimonadota bacterium]
MQRITGIVGKLFWLNFLVLLIIPWKIIVSEEVPVDEVSPEQVDSLASAAAVEVSFAVDSLYYRADSISYNAEIETIRLSGGARIDYHTSRIEADTISLDLKHEQAYSLGQSFLKDRDHFLIGNSIYYDLDSQWGLIREGASQFDKGFYYGREIRKVDKQVYDVDRGIFTTCNSLYPHFYIKASRLRLYQDDKIVARPVVFLVNHFPVLAFPFGTFTIKRGRKTGILVPSPGYNSTDGKFIENIAYYYAYKDYADFILAFDYYEKTGWQGSFNIDYIKRYNYRGKMLASIRKMVISPEKSRYEWHLKSTHHSDFLNDTTFDSNLEFISSKNIWEGNENLDERLSEKITSRLAYKRPLWGSNLRISSEYIDDLKNETKDIILPSLSYSLPSRPVYELFVSENTRIDEDAWWSNFSYSYKFLALHRGDINNPHPDWQEVLYETVRDSLGNVISQHNAGAKHSLGLSYSYKYRGWLNLSQAVSYNEAWFDRDRNNHKLVRGADYYTSSKVSFSLYGLREFSRFYVNTLRHIISPSLTFTYRPDFSGNEKFYSFGGISLSQTERQRRLYLVLENVWQLKVGAAGGSQGRKLNDFFKINSSVSYDFEQDLGYSDISHNLQLRPGTFRRGVMTFSTVPVLKITQDVYGLKIKDWDPGRWDMAVKNWTFDLTSKLGFSGDALYIDYFPQLENRLSSSRFSVIDSVETSDDTPDTFAELEMEASTTNNWSVSFSHYFRTNKARFKEKDYSSDLRTTLTAKITQNWTISYNNLVDLKNEELVSHEITLTRELHCWKIVFRYTRQRNYWSYSFKLFNIMLPEDLKFSTSDNRK